MALCKYCGRKGLFLSLDANGLCKNCQPIVIHNIQQSARIISDSMKLAEEGKSFQTRISRCDLVIEHALQLLDYENKNIPTIDPLPSELYKEYSIYREKIIIEESNRLFEKAIKKVNLAISIRSKENILTNSILKIEEILSKSKVNKSGRDIIDKIKNKLHTIKLDGFIDSAKKAEFKGQIKKAIDQYQEALYYLYNDNIPDDLQKDKITEIKNKIEILSTK